MSKLNCPNCGAPISADNNKCPYCDTSYFDLSAIDINDNKPFYLKIRMGKQTITQLVRVIPNISVEITDNTYSAYGGIGNKLLTFNTNRNMSINMEFKAIQQSNNVLSTITYEE